jgi:uncharacterized OsmC-like protein
MCYDTVSDQYILNRDISGVQNSVFEVRDEMGEDRKTPSPIEYLSRSKTG